MEITSTDVSERWIEDGPIPVPDTVLTVLVDDALTLIAEEFPDIDARVASLELNERTVKIVVAGMVIRAIKQGHEYRTSVSQTQGPFAMSASFSGNGEAPQRGVYLTEQERERLAPRRVRQAKIFTVEMGEENPVISDELRYGWRLVP